MYESVVAQELRAHGHKLFYYDNRKQGEVDYLVDDHLKKLLRSIDEIKRPFASKESSINGEQASDVLSELNGEQASDVLSECKDSANRVKYQIYLDIFEMQPISDQRSEIRD